jgi:hypothetical protein
VLREEPAQLVAGLALAVVLESELDGEDGVVQQPPPQELEYRPEEPLRPLRDTAAATMTPVATATTTGTAPMVAGRDLVEPVPPAE